MDGIIKVLNQLKGKYHRTGRRAYKKEKEATLSKINGTYQRFQDALSDFENVYYSEYVWRLFEVFSKMGGSDAARGKEFLKNLVSARDK